MPAWLASFAGNWLVGWNRITLYTIGIIGVVISMLGMRYAIRRGARKDIEARMKEQGYEQIKRTNKAVADAAGVPVDKWLREHGYLRD
jgi:hypothetical protein